MSFSKPKIPKTPAMPTFLGETTSSIVRNRTRKRLASLQGRRSSLLTGGPAATTTPKTLLGA